MNALEELETALHIITGGSDATSPLAHVADDANNISEIFRNKNGYLYQGWEGIGDFCDRYAWAIHNEFDNLYKELHNFVEASKVNENQELRAVDKANEVAEMILKELGIE